MSSQHNLQSQTTAASTDISEMRSGTPSSRQEGMRQLVDLSMPIDTKQIQANIDDVLQEAMRTISSSLKLTSDTVNEARQRLMLEHPALQQAYGDDGKLANQRDDSSPTEGTIEALENTKQTVDAIFQNARKTAASFETSLPQADEKALASLDQEPGRLERNYQAFNQHEQQDFQKAVLAQHDKQQQISQDKQASLNQAALCMQQTLLERQRAYEQKVLGDSRNILEQEANAAETQIQVAQEKGKVSEKTEVSSIESELTTMNTELSKAATLIDQDIEEDK